MRHPEGSVNRVDGQKGRKVQRTRIDYPRLLAGSYTALAHARSTDRSVLEIAEAAISHWAGGDMPPKDAPCELRQDGKGPLTYTDDDCGGNGDERPFLDPHQKTCPNHYWSAEDLELVEWISRDLAQAVAAMLYNRYGFRRA